MSPRCNNQSKNPGFVSDQWTHKPVSKWSICLRGLSEVCIIFCWTKYVQLLIHPLTQGHLTNCLLLYTNISSVHLTIWKSPVAHWMFCSVTFWEPLAQVCSILLATLFTLALCLNIWTIREFNQTLTHNFTAITDLLFPFRNDIWTFWQGVVVKTVGRLWLNVWL